MALATGQRILLWCSQVKGKYLDTGACLFAVPGWYTVEKVDEIGRATIKSEKSGCLFEGEASTMEGVDKINQEYAAAGHIVP